MQLQDKLLSISIHQYMQCYNFYFNHANDLSNVEMIYF